MKKDDVTFLKRELKKLSEELDTYTKEEASQQLVRLKNVLNPINNDSVAELNAATDLICTVKYMINGVVKKDSKNFVSIKKSDFDAVSRCLSKLNKIEPRFHMDESYTSGVIFKYNVLGIMRGDL
jgi:hypothetical protein